MNIRHASLPLCGSSLAVDCFGAHEVYGVIEIENYSDSQGHDDLIPAVASSVIASVGGYVEIVGPFFAKCC